MIDEMRTLSLNFMQTHTKYKTLRSYVEKFLKLVNANSSKTEVFENVFEKCTIFNKIVWKKENCRKGLNEKSSY